MFVKYNITKGIVIVIAKSWKLIDRKWSKAETGRFWGGYIFSLLAQSSRVEQNKLTLELWSSPILSPSLNSLTNFSVSPRKDSVAITNRFWFRPTRPVANTLRLVGHERETFLIRYAGQSTATTTTTNKWLLRHAFDMNVHCKYHQQQQHHSRDSLFAVQMWHMFCRSIIFTVDCYERLAHTCKLSVIV